jgi:hypothetical protein
MLTGAVMASMALLPMQSAQADDKKSKTYKTGAIALGVLGAYMAVKGKTLPAVVAGAGAYYAYKKSKDAENGYDRSARNPGDVYPDDVNNRRTNDNRTADSRTRDNDIFASRNDGAYDDGAYNNGSSDDGAYNDDPGYIGLSQSGSSGTTVLK